MSWDLPALPIFPQGSLSSSVVTTVWVGVGVVAFFNLRLGWSLAGLVVPGYLVPLLLIRPWNVVVIIAEGIVTYLLVWSISSLGGRYLGLAHFFGRERFFAILLASVAVRAVFDGFWLPYLGEWVNQHLGLQFDYVNHLHSFGLIIVALIAHNFWKPGLLRGSLWLLVTVFTTFLLVRFGLMEFTNFSLSNLTYLYEEIASSIFDSPKAYIILLTTALIASRMNLHYAWEFNGIIIPSLLALQWYQPSVLLVTFVEVGVLLLAVHMLLKLPWLAHVSLTGARKLFLFFTVAFIYKILLGHGINWLAPRVQVTDYFAFGYLISALLAVKIHDKHIGIRVTRATLQTSLVAVILASFLGFALSLLPLQMIDDRRHEELPSLPLVLDTSLDAFLLRQRMLEYASIEREEVPLPTRKQLTLFQQAIMALKQFRADGDLRHLQLARLRLGRLDYELLSLEDRYLVLRDSAVPRGWGTYVIDTDTPGELVIEVPAGRERGAADAGLALFHHQKAAALAIDSVQQRSRAEGAIDVTRNTDTLFHRFHQHFNPENTLQVRLSSPSIAEEVRREKTALPGNISRLQVKRQLPPGLELQPLEALLGRLALHWEAPRIRNVQRDSTASGFAELFLSPEAFLSLLSQDARRESNIRKHRGSLHADLLDRAARLRKAGQAAFVEPGLATLLYFDREVLSPLLRLLEHSTLESEWPEATWQELGYLDGLANGIGYRLVRYVEPNQAFLVLEASEQAPASPPWGTYVFRTSESKAHLVEVPRPFFELYTLETGVALFQQLEARALLIAGRHPFPEPKGQLDVIDPESPRQLFNLVHQVVVREAGDTPLMISQVRGMETRSTLSSPSIVALARGVSPSGEALLTKTPLGLELESRLSALGLSPREMQGKRSTIGYEVGFNAQAQYLDATRHKAFASLWVTPGARHAFAPQSERRQQQAQFNALGIETVTLPLTEHVMARGLATQGLPKAMQELLRRYHRTGDIMVLRQLQKMSGYRLTRLLTPDTDQAFLLITTDDAEGILAIANLAPIGRKTATLKADDTSMAAMLEHFATSRTFLLHSGGSP